MRAILFLVSLSAAAAELPPPGITVSQWVREDIFAGFLGGDMATFEKGMGKVRALLAARPNDDGVRGWLASGQLFLAIRAYKDNAGGAAKFAEAMENARQSLAKQDPTAIRVLSATYVLFGDRLPEEHRASLLKEGRDLFALIRKQEDRQLDKMPLHLKGELLSGQAQAAMRLGLDEEAKRYLTEIVTRLPDTAYAKTAGQWLKDPASAGKSQLVCQSCHEPNRLENRMKSLGLRLQ